MPDAQSLPPRPSVPTAHAKVVVTGSIATDHLMSFGGRYSEVLLPESLARLSVSFLVDDLVIRRGGAGANIAFGLGVLGRSPVLVGSVGADAGDYTAWLQDHGVDTASIRVSDTAKTARFTVTTDTEQNQIASFYPGAMSEAREIALGPIAARTGGIDIVVVSPNDPVAMVRHTAEAHENGWAVLADPSQQLAWLDADDVRLLTTGAAYLMTNEYERDLLESKTGWTREQVLEQVGVRITTLSADGVEIAVGGESPVVVPAVPARTIAEPTGVGDSFRAGFLAGRGGGLDLVPAARLGALIATLTLETVGTQEYVIDRADALVRLTDAYGPEATAEIAPLLPA